MDKKEELLYILNGRKNQYSKKILLKGVFFLFNGFYYPIKLFFLPNKNDQSNEPKEFNYGNLLLAEEWIDVERLKEIVNLLVEETELEVLSCKIKIPKGYFRDIEEDSTKISQQFGGHSSLSDFERKLLKDSRSFPKSLLRQWPSKTYLFKFKIENDCNNLYHKKSWEPLPIKEGLPAIPDYHTAINWWLDKELSYIQDWIIAFYLPDFSARIKKVKFSKDSFIINVEAGILAVDDLAGKYYIKYENISPETGEVAFSENNKIQIKDKVSRFYIVIYNKKDSSVRIDYRDYDWRHLYQDRESLDIEYEEENIEYWVARGEDEEVEFKLELENYKTDKEYLETVCSFSNTYGGRIFVGVDNNGNVKGLNETQIERYQKKIPDLIRNWIEPQVQPKIEVVELREKKIITVRIIKGGNSPYNYKDHGIYIRAGSTDRIATRDEVLSLIPEKSLRE